MAKNRLVLALLLGLSSVSACISQPTAPLPGAPPMPPLRVSATTGKSTYLPGEDVQITLSFTSVGSEPFEITPFPPLVKIARSEPFHEPVHSFPAGTGSKALALGEVATYTVTWDQRDNQNQQVPYGYYGIALGEYRIGNTTMTWSKRGREQRAPILILPTEGTLEKVIDVNKSETVNGTTFTLERVELSASGMFVYGFSSPPPGYTFPPGWIIHAFAEYRVDGGSVIDAGPDGAHPYSDRIGQIWLYLDPVPKGARELTFRITRLHGEAGGAEYRDWQGPWQFLISLQ